MTFDILEASLTRTSPDERLLALADGLHTAFVGRGVPYTGRHASEAYLELAEALMQKMLMAIPPMVEGGGEGRDGAKEEDTPSMHSHQLLPRDIGTLRRWARQVERLGDYFSDERAVQARQAATLLFSLSDRRESKPGAGGASTKSRALAANNLADDTFAGRRMFTPVTKF